MLSISDQQGRDLLRQCGEAAVEFLFLKARTNDVDKVKTYVRRVLDVDMTQLSDIIPSPADTRNQFLNDMARLTKKGRDAVEGVLCAFSGLREDYLKRGR